MSSNHCQTDSNWNQYNKEIKLFFLIKNNKNNYTILTPINYFLILKNKL